MKFYTKDEDGKIALWNERVNDTVNTGEKVYLEVYSSDWTSRANGNIVLESGVFAASSDGSKKTFESSYDAIFWLINQVTLEANR